MRSAAFFAAAALAAPHTQEAAKMCPDHLTVFLPYVNALEHARRFLVGLGVTEDTKDGHDQPIEEEEQDEAKGTTLPSCIIRADTSPLALLCAHYDAQDPAQHAKKTASLQRRFSQIVENKLTQKLSVELEDEEAAIVTPNLAQGARAAFVHFPSTTTQQLSDLEFAVAIRARLGLPPVQTDSVGETCSHPVCKNVSLIDDPWHPLKCPCVRKTLRNQQHNAVQSKLFQVIQDAGITVIL